MCIRDRDTMAMQRLKEAGEKAKKDLSGVVQTQISLPFISAGADAVSYTHLDVYKRQRLGCIHNHENALAARKRALRPVCCDCWEAVSVLRAPEYAGWYSRSCDNKNHRQSCGFFLYMRQAAAHNRASEIHDRRKTDRYGRAAVSYTHLDVYKRQALMRIRNYIQRKQWSHSIGLQGIRVSAI